MHISLYNINMDENPKNDMFRPCLLRPRGQRRDAVKWRWGSPTGQLSGSRNVGSKEASRIDEASLRYLYSLRAAGNRLKGLSHKK